MSGEHPALHWSARRPCILRASANVAQAGADDFDGCSLCDGTAQRGRATQLRSSRPTNPRARRAAGPRRHAPVPDTCAEKSASRLQPYEPSSMMSAGAPAGVCARLRVAASAAPMIYQRRCRAWPEAASSCMHAMAQQRSTTATPGRKKEPPPDTRTLLYSISSEPGMPQRW